MTVNLKTAKNLTFTVLKISQIHFLQNICHTVFFKLYLKDFSFWKKGDYASSLYLLFCFKVICDPIFCSDKENVRLCFIIPALLNSIKRSKLLKVCSNFTAFIMLDNVRVCFLTILINTPSS